MPALKSGLPSGAFEPPAGNDPLCDSLRSSDPYVRLYALMDIAKMRSLAEISDEAAKFLRELRSALSAALERGEANALADGLAIDRISEILEGFDGVDD